MKRSGWIVVGSLATLVLCAAPYGCSGKYVGAPGSAGSANNTPLDGAGYPYPGGDGAVMRTEGTAYSVDGSGTCCVSEGRRQEGTVYGDGFPYPGGDGAYVGGDGAYIPIESDGYDHYADGTADGTSVDYPDGQGNPDGNDWQPEGYYQGEGYGG